MKIKLNDVSVSFADKVVLSHINFEVNQGEKIAIIGRNGCGKTTLLKVIMGEQEIDTVNDSTKINRIEKTGTFRIGHLKQVSFEDDNITMEQEILKAYSKVLDLKQKMNELEKQFAISDSPKLFDEYSKCCEQFDSEGGYTYQKEINLALKNFDFTDNDKHKKLKEFSGGQQTKIAFIKLLLSKPDLLILDEPTNHLDIKAIEWLENYLLEYKNSVIVVSHDRAFIDKFVNVVYEIERHKMTRYVGNYSDFVKQKQFNYEKQLKDYNEYKNEVNRLQTLVDKFRYKATKAKMAQSKIKQIERMEQVENPELADNQTFYANIKPNKQSGTDVINFKNVIIGYDKPLTSSINFKLTRGERVGIIGGNGLGKSTFLKTIMDKVKLLGGKMVFGQNVEIGYFDQFTASSNIADETIFENYHKCYPSLSDNEVRSDLGAFMFSQEDVFKNLKDLSGGELVRLEFCKILKKKPNTLLLDEPTNHLDIVGKEALENMLLKFDGTILFVSHDRFFINKLATSLLVFENGTSKFYLNTTYEEYIRIKQEKEKQLEIAPKEIEKSDKNENKSQLKMVETKSQKEIKSDNLYVKNKENNKKKVRINKLEKEILGLENEIKDLQLKYQEPDYFNDFVKTQELDELIVQKQIKLNELTETWYKETAE